jgi:hypothetical protein
MDTIKALKRSLGGHKGQFKVALLSFNSICSVKPQPTYTTLEQSYNKVRGRIESIFTVCESIMKELREIEDTTIDVPKETEEIETYLTTIVDEQSKIESAFVELQSKLKPPEVVVDAAVPAALNGGSAKPRVRITSISPPTWNGNKADFYT